MTIQAQTSPAPVDASPAPPAPQGWRELRGDENIQFEPVEIPEPEPPEPGWLEDLFEYLGDLFGPVGSFIASWWFVLQWVLIAAVAAFAIYAIYRFIGPTVLAPKSARDSDAEEPEWTPDKAESIALLEDADKLAAQGKFDEATHLLLQRSVGQIARARPDWVEPSSTARELAALPALSARARSTFAVISERVERSLFALRSLNRDDWEAARSAYAEFALAKIDTGQTL